MKSILNIQIEQDVNQIRSCTFNLIEVSSEGEPENVYAELVKSIKQLQIDNNLTCENLCNKLCELRNYSTNIEENDAWIDYEINVVINRDEIVMSALNRNNVECFRQTYVVSKTKEGNCVDDFIKRAIDPLLKDINELKKNIESRKNERSYTNEYHMTSCYENDFLQISMIKKKAEKIVKNCQKHLEQISDFYSKN